jgi:HEAT repeat protein
MQINRNTILLFIILGISLCLIPGNISEARENQNANLLMLLNEAAHGESYWERAKSVKNLIEYKNPKVVNVLIDAMSDKNELVRKNAVGSLYHLTGQFLGYVPSDPLVLRAIAIQRWRDWWDKNNKSIVKQTQKTGYPEYERDIERLVKVIKDERTSWRGGDMFIEVFERIGIDAVTPLATGLNSDRKHVRWWSSSALGKTGAKSAIPYLINKIKVNPEDVDVIALGWLNATSAIRPLIALLKNDNEELRYYTCKLLGDIGDRSTIEPLRDTWKNDISKRVRIEALIALVHNGDRDSVNIMVETLYKGRMGTDYEFGKLLTPLSWEVSQILGKEHYSPLSWKNPIEEVQENAKLLWNLWDKKNFKLIWDDKTRKFRAQWN